MSNLTFKVKSDYVETVGLPGKQIRISFSDELEMSVELATNLLRIGVEQLEECGFNYDNVEEVFLTNLLYRPFETDLVVTLTETEDRFVIE